MIRVRLLMAFVAANLMLAVPGYAQAPEPGIRSMERVKIADDLLEGCEAGDEQLILRSP